VEAAEDAVLLAVIADVDRIWRDVLVMARDGRLHSGRVR